VALDTFCPWKEHLFAEEADLGADGAIKYVLYADSNGAHRIQCVPAAPASFATRLGLPEAWRGLRDEALSAATGVEGGACDFKLDLLRLDIFCVKVVYIYIYPGTHPIFFCSRIVSRRHLCARWRVHRRVQDIRGGA
jgi:hypothetical protein